MISSETPQAVGLRADRVDLAVHLLQQEIELAAARLGAVAERVPVREVRAEPGHFLADVGARAARTISCATAPDRPAAPARSRDALAQPRFELAASLVGGRAQPLDQLREQRLRASRSARRCSPSRTRIASRSASACSTAASHRETRLDRRIGFGGRSRTVSACGSRSRIAGRQRAR